MKFSIRLGSITVSHLLCVSPFGLNFQTILGVVEGCEFVKYWESVKMWVCMGSSHLFHIVHPIATEPPYGGSWWVFWAPCWSKVTPWDCACCGTKSWGMDPLIVTPTILPFRLSRKVWISVFNIRDLARSSYVTRPSSKFLYPGLAVSSRPWSKGLSLQPWVSTSAFSKFLLVVLLLLEISPTSRNFSETTWLFNNSYEWIYPLKNGYRFLELGYFPIFFFILWQGNLYAFRNPLTHVLLFLRPHPFGWFSLSSTTTFFGVW